MTFAELKKKLTDLIDAYRNLSNIVKADETALRKVLLEVKRAMGEVKAVLDKKIRLEEAKKSLAARFNELYTEEERIFNSNALPLPNKVAQLSKICALKSATISDLDDTIKQLEKLEKEMAENELGKKMELIPMWKEVKAIYEVEDFEDEEEMEISDSVAAVAPVKKEEDFDTLMEALKQEISSSKEQEEKKSFFGGLFSKKGA